MKEKELVRILDRCSGKEWELESALIDSNVTYHVQMGYDFTYNHQVLHSGSYAYLGYSGGVVGLSVYELSRHGMLIKTGAIRFDYATTHFANMVKYGNTICASYGLGGVMCFDISDKSNIQWAVGKGCGNMYAGSVAIAFKHIFTTSYRSSQFSSFAICRITDKILHLPFNEVGGPDAVDVSGHHNHGTLHNCPSRITCWNPAGCGLSFDGRDDIVTVENPEIYGSMMTASLWVKPYSKQNAALVAKTEGPDLQQHYYMLALDNEQRLRGVLKTAGTTSELFSAPQSIPIHKWIHVAMTYKDGQFMLYIDGKKTASASKSGMIDWNDSVRVTIGNSPRGEKNSAFSGVIRDVRLYDYDLDADELSELADDSPTVAKRVFHQNSFTNRGSEKTDFFDLRGRKLIQNRSQLQPAKTAIVVQRATNSAGQNRMQRIVILQSGRAHR